MKFEGKYPIMKISYVGSKGYNWQHGPIPQEIYIVLEKISLNHLNYTIQSRVLNTHCSNTTLYKDLELELWCQQWMAKFHCYMTHLIRHSLSLGIF